MFSPKNALILLAALTINSGALAAPSPLAPQAANSDTAVLNCKSGAITPEDQSMCCYCTGGRQQTETACGDVGFGMCHNGSGDGCGIWVGHANDLNNFGNLCRLLGGGLQGCVND